MAAEKFPLASEIGWSRIKEVRVSSDGGSYSFEFELSGKKQLLTISIAPGQTGFVLSKPDGSPIVHAMQKGREIRVVDFSKMLSLKPTSFKAGAIKRPKRHG